MILLKMKQIAKRDKLKYRTFLAIGPALDLIVGLLLEKFYLLAPQPA